MDYWAGLSASDRIYMCYWMAEEGRRLAQTSPPRQARIYRALARKWMELATQIAASEGLLH